MKFDIEHHEKTHHGYLEVMISPDGEIEYAIPSHQMYLMQKAKEVTNLTEDEINKLCPNEYYCDFMRWLFFISGYFPVWEKFVLDNVQVTQAQYTALRKLKMHGLYKGNLPKIKPLSRCPICGAEAKRSEVSLNDGDEAEYKYNCSYSATHVGCGSWFTSEKKARADWEKRCMGFGQPESYRPTNAEYIKRLMQTAKSGAELYHAIDTAHQMMTNISSDREANVWLSKRFVPDKCRNCLKQQMTYCVCKPFVPPEYLYIVSLFIDADSKPTRQVATRNEDDAFKLLADGRNTLCRYSKESGAEYWSAAEKEWKNND